MAGRLRAVGGGSTSLLASKIEFHWSLTRQTAGTVSNATLLDTPLIVTPCRNPCERQSTSSANHDCGGLECQVPTTTFKNLRTNAAADLADEEAV
jgi:hypothetical protein